MGSLIKFVVGAAVVFMCLPLIGWAFLFGCIALGII